ncbi:hypothetical protein OG889_25690 [Streptomyces sp. NBC_00481]|uniref:hypothetical protein n=1 Tax=Streptomyces sp. NBC_00481 TaxID=2975755 RepID=UPI002DD88C02|nr:hypothetical protein [Streptomyces sp. NBC_00481]WRY97799.1 hypothetical protein OG889_25690 [Streptomyces sp. NBC_00481]
MPEDQRRHFDAEIADTEIADAEIEALPEMLHRWVALSNDGWPGSGPRPAPTASRA